MSGCKKAILALVSLLTLSIEALAADLSIIDTTVTDNGDADGFADTNETVSVHVTVKNISGRPLQNVTATLLADTPGRACLTAPTIEIGNLATGEVRVVAAPFVFHVPPAVDRTALGLGPYAPLSVTFAVSVAAGGLARQVHPEKLSFDLDLDVSGGGSSTTYLESFENGLGTFAVDNMDFGRGTLAAADGFRCQYSDPDNPNSGVFGQDDSRCHPGNSPAHADATWWGISGPETSPDGPGRGFSGFHSLFFGFDFGEPKFWTTPTSILEAAGMTGAIPLGWQQEPVLSFKHQVSLVDSRTTDLDPGETYDRGVVMVQAADAAGNPVGPWHKVYPFQNGYDQRAVENFNTCSFDPIDDGNTEDDFFDPSDPERNFGPSSTCWPDPIFAFLGGTSNQAFDPAALGHAAGPGLDGQWGIGTWVESKVDLSRFRGRGVRVRFVVSAFQVGGTTIETWDDLGGAGFNPHPGDDGWWIDDVTITGAVTTPATMAVDTKNNSGLPGPPTDGDGDGVGTVCDNCPSVANATQWDRDFDTVGNNCDICVADPSNVDDDGDSFCNLEDNCPAGANPEQTDADDDSYGPPCDCNDASNTTHPGAFERNDGVDNGCPGDYGYGVEDELAPTLIAASRTRWEWQQQVGATRYQLARSVRRDFSQGCAVLLTNPFDNFYNDTLQPPTNVKFFILVRPYTPNRGSWGQRSDGVERTVPCAP